MNYTNKYSFCFFPFPSLCHLFVCLFSSLSLFSVLTVSSWISTISTWRWTTKWLWRCYAQSWLISPHAGGWQDGPLLLSPSLAACWVITMSPVCFIIYRFCSYHEKSWQTNFRKWHKTCKVGHKSRILLPIIFNKEMENIYEVYLIFFVLWNVPEADFSALNRIYLLFFPVEDGDALDPCILATLRKLQDGYFAGARSVPICDT